MTNSGIGGVGLGGYITPDALAQMGMSPDLKLTPDQLQSMYNGGIDAPKTDWGMNGMGGVALGAGQLGLGVLGYLENQKTADVQRKLLNQQYDTNASELAHTQAARKAASGGLGAAAFEKPITRLQ